MLTAAAAGSGALAGFGLAVLGLVLPTGRVGPWVVAAAVLVAVALDAVGPRPLAVRRQVPRTWARAFPPATAAFLYGARLGVGPLTLLPTWLWWAAAVVGAVAGVGWSVAVGAGFGTARVLVMLAAAHGGEADMAGRMAAVRRREDGVRRATLWIGALAAAVLLSACTDEAAPRVGSATTTTTTSTVTPPVVVDAAALPDEIVPGYVRVADADRPGRLGPLDLAAAAEAEADTAAERSLLATRRFRGGLARAWRSPEGDELYIAVYEFADEAGAAAYLRDGLITLDGRAAQQYPVEGLPGAVGFSQAERREAAAVTSHGVVLARGSRFWLVVAASAHPGSTPSLVADAARRLAG